MDAGKISRPVQTNRATGERRTGGMHRGDVGRAGPEYAGWRIVGVSDSGGQAVFPEEFRRGRKDRMESGFVWLQLATAADLQEVRNGLFRDPETALGARIHNLSLQAFLVAGAGWQPL